MATRRALLAGAVLPLVPGHARAASDTFLVTNSAADTLAFLDGESGTATEVTVGAAPWGIAVSSSKRAYVATAGGVAAIDLSARQRRFLVPYQSWSGEAAYGEYRPGGMGIAVSPDGKRVFTGVYLPDGPSVIEVLDVATREIIATAPAGVRPFQLIAGLDGGAVYAIDHDSYTVTVLDTTTFATRTLPAAPLGDANGLSGFEKPHYAALAPDGALLLPFQGQVLLQLDPRTGESTTIPLTTNTHQHGIALSPDGVIAAIVGVGPAGSAAAGPSLTLLSLASGEETIYPLNRPHETCAWSSDGARIYLTGGYSFANGGWDGLTVVERVSGAATEWPLGARPLAIVRVP